MNARPAGRLCSLFLAAALLPLGPDALSLGVLSTAAAAEPQTVEEPLELFVVRAAPLMLKEKRVGTAAPGEVLTAVTKNADWYWIPGKDGWISGAAVERLDRTLPRLNEALKKSPTAENHELRGLALVGLERYPEAIEDFNAAIGKRPQNPSFYINRGNAFRFGQDFPAALSDYSYALKLDPKNPIAWKNRAAVLIQMKEWKQAAEAVNQAIRLDPKFTAAYIDRGVISQWQKNDRAALRDFDKALDLSPGNAVAFGNRAVVNQSLRRYKQAKADYEQSLSLSPNRHTVMNNYAWFLATTPEKSLRDVEQATKLAEKANQMTAYKNWQYLDTLAAAYAAGDQFDLALKRIGEAIQLAPAAERAELQRHRMLFRRKQPVGG